MTLLDNIVTNAKPLLSGPFALDFDYSPSQIVSLRLWHICVLKCRTVEYGPCLAEV